MIYRRIEEIDEPPVEAASLSGVRHGKVQDSGPSKRKLDPTIGHNKRELKRAKRQMNDLNHYQGILSSFKRIRIISLRGSVVEDDTNWLTSANLGLPSVVEDDNWSTCGNFGLSSGLDTGHPAAEWRYYFPGGEDVFDLEAMKHYLIRLGTACGDDHVFAPVKDTCRLRDGAPVLDMGTGTGIWATECKYPSD
jgi:hypothetical protein